MSLSRGIHPGKLHLQDFYILTHPVSDSSGVHTEKLIQVQRGLIQILKGNGGLHDIQVIRLTTGWRRNLFEDATAAAHIVKCQETLELHFCLHASVSSPPGMRLK